MRKPSGALSCPDDSQAGSFPGHADSWAGPPPQLLTWSEGACPTTHPGRLSRSAQQLWLRGLLCCSGTTCGREGMSGPGPELPRRLHVLSEKQPTLSDCK